MVLPVPKLSVDKIPSQQLGRAISGYPQHSLNSLTTMLTTQQAISATAEVNSPPHFPFSVPALPCE